MMKNARFLLCGVLLASASYAAPAGSQILGWNNLGMHCMDSDYSVFSILPPYNTIEAQLIFNGKLVKSGSGYTLTYQAVADPAGSFNSTAMGKGNYYTYAQALFGKALVPEAGLADWSMPGTGNTPQGMLFEINNVPAKNVSTPVNWWRAEGIPISPYDDAHNKNPYPLMRIIARSGSTVIAQNDIVLPVSDEMDCRACHASGTQAAAQPAAGWVWNGLQERDFRLNILRLHDEHQFARHNTLYVAALAARGFNAQGLYRGVLADGKPVLCAACHASEALGAPSYGSIPQLTTSIHAYHAQVRDPVLNTKLDDSSNRGACYRCHPGSTTKCLRGAMGGAIASNGSMEMQCQSCHGNMSAVGSGRTGWFDEPNCQSCHTGTATSNMGQIRYTSALGANGLPRVPSNWDPLNPPTGLNTTFATTPNTPAPGLSLYRFGYGHGGLQCSACHGSTHAEFPSTHVNDNLRNTAIQGHAGVMIECTSCHTGLPSTIAGGPHGMHPLGDNWAQNHGDLFEGSPPAATRAQCQACHGGNYKGTVLSRAQGSPQGTTRTISTKFGTRSYWRGRVVSCYDCHNGGTSSDPTTHPPATAQTPAPATATGGSSVAIPLSASGGGTLTWRVVSQPAHGSVAISNNTATYLPDPGFVGTDSFTLATNNTWVDSNLVTATVNVGEGPISITASAQVPPTYPAGWPVALAVVPTVTNSNATPSFDWDFGDGTAHGSSQFPTHAYAAPGTYTWSVKATVATKTTTDSGTIMIEPPVALGVSHGSNGNTVTLSWPNTTADTLLQTSPDLGVTSPWQWVSTPPTSNGGLLQVTVPASGSQFFRVSRPW